MTMAQKLTLSAKISRQTFLQDPDLSSLKDARVLITGGASGLGAAFAEAYAAAGAFVTIVDLNEPLVNSHAKSLKQKGYSVQAVVADVTSWTSQVNAFRTALNFGPGAPRIDHVIASAGIDTQPFFPPTEEQVPSADSVPAEPPTQIFDINDKGVVYTTRLAQYYMSIQPVDTQDQTRDKSILLIASTGAYWSIPMNGLYNASKGAIRTLFRTMRGPMATRGIRLNLLNPWLIKTPLTVHLVDLFGSVGYPVCDPPIVTQAVMRIAADRGIVGRSVQAGLGDYISDMRDDSEGFHGGAEVNRLIEEHLGGLDNLNRMHNTILTSFGFEGMVETL